MCSSVFVFSLLQMAAGRFMRMDLQKMMEKRYESKTFPPLVVLKSGKCALGCRKVLELTEGPPAPVASPNRFNPTLSLPASDTLYLCIYCPTGARVACKGNVIGVCEACACPCLVGRHVCGPAVNKASVSAVHTYPIRRSLAHSLPALFLISTMQTVSSEPGGDMCQVAAGQASLKIQLPLPGRRWPPAPFVRGACTSRQTH